MPDSNSKLLPNSKLLYGIVDGEMGNYSPGDIWQILCGGIANSLITYIKDEKEVFQISDPSVTSHINGVLTFVDPRNPEVSGSIDVQNILSVVQTGQVWEMAMKDGTTWVFYG